MILDSHDRVNEPQKRSSASIWNSLEGYAQSMIHRIPFLLMAIVQALFALRCLRNPEAAKAVNVQQGTIWAKLPLSFYRAIGVLCAGAAILFLYLFLGATSKLIHYQK
jgi:hypothetical protein